MSTEGIPFDRWDIRGADSNSLLRMYDSAAGALNSSPLQLQRERAEKAMLQIAKELRKRKLRCRARAAAASFQTRRSAVTMIVNLF